MLLGILHDALSFDTEICISISGWLGSPIPQSRGLRQGDSLSSLLFNIAFEPLLRSIQICSGLSGDALGNGVVSFSVYSLVPPVWIDTPNSSDHDFISDSMVYYPLSTPFEELRPVIIEIQTNVTKESVWRTIRYCLDLLEDTKVAPILITFNISSITGNFFFDDTFTKESSYYTQSSHLWAHQAYLYNSDSIKGYVDEIPMSPIIALTYFLTERQRNIIALTKYDDPTVIDLYRHAYTIFTDRHDDIQDKEDALLDHTQAISLQFQKITNCQNDDPYASLKRIRKYAEDGHQLSQKMIKIIKDDEEEDSPTVTPIELECKKSEDLKFIENYRKSIKGRFIWEEVYNAGLNNEPSLFGRYRLSGADRRTGQTEEYLLTRT
ncbi:uncharacterized protein EV154DRAFT_217290 [Mucor mucedo]|uniref:uncharacterized protein n=1 Tax=Mucor mucedo TaxID=29922 RepID=UPI0022205E76|nr:uncharacterized protein EV154DRAFT_217290 [Mucor mucedo]KAI7891588.1 hypothetical protein EV154DRAFT_217290 [Mucor mucedo]